MGIIRAFTCPLCGHKFFTQRAFDYHLKTAHNK